MLNIYCNTEKHEYDIRALVMAFYPYQKLAYHTDGDRDDEKAVHIMLEPDAISVRFCSVSRRQKFDSAIETPAYRNALKRLIYDVLSECTGRKLMWGTLTGVRPSKLPMKAIMSGSSLADAVAGLKEEYYCSDEKAQLAARVAGTELNILQKTDYRNGYSVYLGIPFCPTICNYCSFSSTSLAGLRDADELMGDYIDALEKECMSVRDICPGKKLTSLYIGGGTPTALTEEYLKRLMDIVNRNYPVRDAFEFTVEAGRPDSINEEKLRILKEAGVTRISVNPQTMKEETLKNIGRKHTVGQMVHAFRLAREAGFDNINMDLIAGLTGENEEDFNHTLDALHALDPDSFTVHSLVIKRASEYRQQVEAASNSVRTDASSYSETVENMLLAASGYAWQNGYAPYYMYRQKNKAGLSDNPVLENVGYSREGKEGIYNILIMEEKQTIIALGAGAASKMLYEQNDKENNEIAVRSERIANVKNVREYIFRIDEMIKRKKRWSDDG